MQYLPLLSTPWSPRWPFPDLVILQSGVQQEIRMLRSVTNKIGQDFMNWSIVILIYCRNNDLPARNSFYTFRSQRIVWAEATAMKVEVALLVEMGKMNENKSSR